MNHAASTQEWTLGELLTARYMMCRRFCSKRWHSRDAKSTVKFQKTIRAVMALGLGLGIAAAGGWCVTLMVVHVFHALTALPSRAREVYSWLGT